ncbi:MAG TPA: hypothetical protein VET69_10120, partial [Terriglobales bacterium]|nr:hypothetical protein [Terriglobales bacterium]
GSALSRNPRIPAPSIRVAQQSWKTALDLMADGAHRVGSSEIEKSGVVAVPVSAGCPDGQSRKNVLAMGGVGVLIHHVNTN